MSTMLTLTCIIMPGCLPSSEYRQGLDKAEEGLSRLTEDFLIVGQMSFIDSYDHIWSFTTGSGTCFYGRRVMPLGTSLTTIEALDIYTEVLQAREWRIRKNSTDIQSFDTRRAFFLSRTKKIGGKIIQPTQN